MYYWVPFGIVSVFCFIQCYLCQAAVRFVRGQRQVIDGLNEKDDKELRSVTASAWLTWVYEAFPDGTVSSTGWSRDDAFEMLDEELTRDQNYQWLQRMAVMAPLVGVLITALGLTGLSIPANAAMTMAAIVSAVTPLFSGVIIGASLALWNQVLLQIVQWQIEKLRSTARTWFDRAVWARAVSAPREAVEATISALGELARTARETSRLHQRNGIRVKRASGAVVRASVASENAFKTFGTGLAEFSVQIKTLNKVTESTRLVAEALEPSFRHAKDVLTNTVKEFQEVVVEKFIPAANDHGAAAKSSAEMTGRTLSILQGVDDSTRTLQEQSKQLASASLQLGESGDELRKSIQSTLLPAQKSLKEAAGAVSEAATTLPKIVGESAAVFSASAKQLRSTLSGDLAPAAANLRETIKDDLRPMAALQRTLMEQVSEVSNGLKILFEQIKTSAMSLEERYNRLADAANKQSRASGEIHESLKAELIPAQKALGESVSGLTHSTKILIRFLTDGVEPATARLGELSQVIAPMREAAKTIGELGDLKVELRELAEIITRLRQALDSAKVLADLESVISELNRSFQGAADLKLTISEMPELFGNQINAMSNHALRRQADDLKETLFDIAKQFHFFTTVDDGKAG